MYVLGFFIALIMWGWGLLWFSFAIAALWKIAEDRGVPFNMGWWGVHIPAWRLCLWYDTYCPEAAIAVLSRSWYDLRCCGCGVVGGECCGYC
jgi:hypothetical protein